MNCESNLLELCHGEKWYKDTRGKLVEVKVDGLPGSAHEEPRKDGRPQADSSASATSPMRILVCQKLCASE